MKKSSFTCNYQTYIISDDGSIIFINLPHKKKPVQLLMDLSNNPLFISPIPLLKIEPGIELPQMETPKELKLTDIKVV